MTKLFQNFLILLLIGVSNGAISSTFSSSEQDLILEKINEFRRQQGASDMHQVHWDGNLASNAQKQAGRCFEVQNSDEYAFSTISQLTGALEAWFGEKRGFDSSSCACKPGSECKNYVKTVRSQTTKVGCGKSTCANLFQDNTRVSVIKSDVDFIVCKFEVVSTQGNCPFETGKACSKCPTHKNRCLKNLCKDSCPKGDEGEGCYIEPRVTHIYPKEGSLAGGTRITVHGKGFSEDQFNFGEGNEHKGNKVTLISSSGSYPCRPHQDGNTFNKITCYTEPMPEGYYWVRIEVDGKVVTDDRHCGSIDAQDCRFYVTEKRTPYFNGIERHTQPPGEMVKMRGKIVTRYLVSTVLSENTTNGVTDRYTRMWFGGKDCSLVDPEGVEYHAEFDGDGKGQFGTIWCKSHGQFIGACNISGLIEGPWGRTQTKLNLLRVSKTNKIYTVQTYATVTGVSPNVGGDLGSTFITITGKNFDPRTTKVQIAGEECKISTIEDEKIVCKSPAKPSLPSKHPGNRGLNKETWLNENKNFANLDDVRTLTNPTHINWTDETYFSESKLDNYVTRMEGFFIPPEDSEYVFKAKGDDSIKVYLSKDATDPTALELVSSVQSAASDFNKYPEQVSSRISLEKGKAYAVQIIHAEGTQTSKVSVGAHAMKTVFNEGQNAWAKDEIQVIQTTSTVRPEIQKLDMSSFPASQAATAEVQTCVISISSDTISFRLAYNGLPTGSLTKISTAQEIKKELAKLETAVDEKISFTVQATSDASSLTLTVTFDSGLGTHPDLTLVVAPEHASTVTMTVTKSTSGVPGNEKFRLKYGSKVSPVVTVGAKAEKVQEAVESLFSVRCPKKVMANSALEFDDFEGAGEADDIVPFCGKRCRKNPFVLFSSNTKPLSLNNNPMFCIASKGSFLQRVQVKYVCAISGKVEERFINVPMAMSQDDLSWNYTCTNILEYIKSRRQGATVCRVKLLRVNKLSDEAYVDSPSLGPEKPVGEDDPTLLRSEPDFIADDVEVTDNGTNTYLISFQPRDCVHNLNKLEIASATSSDYTVTQEQTTGEPPLGPFTVSYDGKTAVVKADFTERQMNDKLESIDGIEDLKVTRTGKCSGYKYSVKFLTLQGDAPLMTVSDQSSLTGTDATVDITTIQDGGIFYHPIPGDMLSTSHDKPQVEVIVNDVPSRCTGNCDFEYDNTINPTVTSINPTTGTSGTVLTVTGTGFSTTSSKNLVRIGDSKCTVTSATATEIQCTVGESKVGTLDVKVIVMDQSLASSSATFDYTAELISISPTSGSIGGGLILTVTGKGFQDTDVVKVGSVVCSPLKVSPSTITCTVPFKSGGPGSETVTVESSGSAITGSATFNYEDAKTIKLTVDATTAEAYGGATVTIDAAAGGLGYNVRPVLVGEFPAKIVKYADKQIKITLPSLPNGQHELKVKGAHGYAVLDTSLVLPTITVEFEVTGLSVDKCGSFGGCPITITGKGFNTDCSKMKIMFGQVPCDASSCTDTSIECKLGYAAEVHKITNDGVNPKYGKQLAWDPRKIEIQAGDIIHWAWKSPQFVDSLKYRVIETDTETDIEAKSGGFESSPIATPVGSFRRHFSSVGSHYYFSGFVDESQSIFFRGKINIVAREPFAIYLSLKQGSAEATYTLGSGAGKKKRSSCPAKTCSGADPTISDNTKFSLKMLTCLDSQITAISPTEGTSADQITITGTGFGTTDSCVTVEVGQKTCTISSITDTEIVCTIDPGSDLKTGEKHYIRVFVHNNGYAQNVQGSNFAFALSPHVGSLTPASGSLAGNTKVTLTGAGFTSGEVEVKIGLSVCEIESISYTEIVCITPAQSSASTEEITVTVGGFPATCKVGGGCNYDYADASTPKITAINPTSGTSATLTVTGENLGTDKTKLSLKVGESDCVVQDGLTNTQAECVLDSSAAGDNAVTLEKQDAGSAVISNSVSFAGTPTLDSVSPTTGSVDGGTLLTLTGNGFTSDIVIKMAFQRCNVKSITLTQVTCVTPAFFATTTSIEITAGSVTFPTINYEYTNAATPTVTSINPTNGVAGNDITITGTGFDTDKTKLAVTIGGKNCVIATSTETEITCTSDSALPGGSHLVVVDVTGKGLATSTIRFEIAFSISGIVPSDGSIAGGTKITLSGAGFTTTSTVTICDEPCQVTSATTTEVVCITPPSDSAKTCEVILSTENGTETSSYEYSTAKTPKITNVQPRRGGTAGGTSVTITGTGFGSVEADASVSFNGIDWSIESFSSTEIIVRTGEVNRPVGPERTGKGDVTVNINGLGNAENSNGFFEYIDVWSSPFTWGGADPPEEGTLVVIQKGQTVLLDQDTPILKMILIQGGALIFDEKDITLNAENILITDGGLFQIGTEEEPFQHQATVIMHGFIRALELPIYGAKTLALRDGKIEIHGKKVKTWTLLDETVEAGATTIKLTHPCGWKVGDKIVIATTGGHKSQGETETRTITAISADEKTITLDSPLQYKHMGETQTFSDGTQLEVRAEIALLNRNIVIRGSNNIQWNDKIEACPDGFDPGEHATQTCFQGRFGEEVGSDQFGCQIMVHQPQLNAGRVSIRLEYAEVTYSGQAFRLGRYSIHLHLNGDMSGSYVRGCSIHDTFNRAVNIHNTHNVLIEHNVVFNVMGGALFLEDSIERGNIFQYNVIMKVRSSSSLLNDDITPAALWITNPNNTVIHNHVAGGTHFGIWYRMLKHPEGPSFDPNIWPRLEQLGEVNNNTYHSNGWYGTWVFEDFFPTVQQVKVPVLTPAPAIFRNTIAWNNFRGIEFVHAGALQIIGGILANNFMASIEIFHIYRHSGEVEFFTENGVLFKDVKIIAHLKHSDHPPCTKRGIVLPFGRGLLMSGITFIDFDGTKNGGHTCSGYGTVKITCTCNTFCSGYEYQNENIRWVNSPKKAFLEWEHQLRLVDRDGSLTGIQNGIVVSKSNLYPTSNCQDSPEFSVNFPGQICQGINFITMNLNEPLPSSLLYKEMYVENEYGSSLVPFAFERDRYKQGWMAILVSNIEHKFHFVNAEHISNFSYKALFDGIDSNNHMIIKHNLTEPSFDRVYTLPEPADGVNYNSSTDISYSAHENGMYHWDAPKKELSYLVSDRPAPVKRHLREFFLRAENCYYTGCVKPGASEGPLDDKRPSSAVFWSNIDSWKNMPTGYAGGNSLPQPGEKVIIPKDMWMVVDVETIDVLWIEVYGTLEFENKPKADGSFHSITVTTTYMFVKGGRVIAGWANEPFLGNLKLKFEGDHNTPQFPLQDDGPTAGKKVLAVFGGLDLYGKNRTVYWTCLGNAASPGDNKLKLKESVDWEVGEEIVVAPTGYDVSHTETFTITAVSTDKTEITLNGTLQYAHVVSTESYNGKTLEICAEVGLLSRNIKIIGVDKGKMYSQSFGARVIVGITTGLDEFGSLSAYYGYARLWNVEFAFTGQEGYNEPYDPRFSLAIVDTGDVTSNRPSIVVGCSFHNGFSTAIGLFSVNKMIVRDNVIHHVVREGIIVTGSQNQLMNNLVVQSFWSGSYNGRTEEANLEWHGAIDTTKAKLLRMEGNHVAGSERAGFHTAGQFCDVAPENLWKNNVAHTVVIGIYQSPTTPCISSCILYNDFTIYKSNGYGIYLQIKCSATFDKVKLADNYVGLLAMGVGPSLDSHLYKYMEFKFVNGLVVGKSTSFDCNTDVRDKSLKHIKLGSKGLGWTVDGGFVGMSFPLRTSGGNLHPKMPFHLAKTTPAMYGRLHLENTDFARFQETCGKLDRVFSTNPLSIDVQWMIEARNCRKQFVSEKSMFFLHRPSGAKASECVDMDCDGMKKAFFKDLTGGLLDVPGVVFPDSTYEYNGDRSRGLGDYRIPKTMATDPATGNRIPAEQLRKGGLGIIRDDSCQEKAFWPAYFCPTTKYEILLIESMDPDSKTRRIGPIAFQSDTGYLDFLNGPRDVGICAGYTCRHRSSTFWSIVKLSHQFNIYLTGSVPQHMRFHLPYVGPNEGAIIKFYYGLKQRIDCSVDGNYVVPKNAKNGDVKNGYESSSDPVRDFAPKLTDLPGANFFDTKTLEIYVNIKGNKPISCKLIPVVIMEFGVPPMSIDDFYGANLVNNLANFLGIPQSKIRYVNVVSELSVSNRRKRSVAPLKVTIQIGDEPGAVTLKWSDLNNVYSQIQVGVQTGQLSTALKIELQNVTLSAPIPSADNPDWITYIKTIENGGQPVVPIGKPTKLAIDQCNPLHEGAEFTAIVRLADSLGHLVPNSGGIWKIKAEIRRESSANADTQLLGETIVTVTSGFAVFRNLAFSHSGGPYYIDFSVVEPHGSDIKKISSRPFTLLSRPISIIAKKSVARVLKSQSFAFKLELMDSVTKTRISKISWRGQKWLARAELAPVHDKNSYTFDGEVEFDSNGYATIHNKFNSGGFYAIKVIAATRGYTLVKEEFIRVFDKNQKPIKMDSTRRVALRFKNDFSTISDRKMSFGATLANHVRKIKEEVELNDFIFNKGSILANFSVSGEKQDVEHVVETLKQQIKSGLSLDFDNHKISTDPFLYVDGEMIDKLNGDKKESEDSKSLSTGAIVGIAVGSTFGLLIIILLIVIIIVLAKKGKKATFDKERVSDSPPPPYLGNNPPAITKYDEIKVIPSNERRPTNASYVSGKVSASSLSIGTFGADSRPGSSRNEIVTNLTPNPSRRASAAAVPSVN